ncbi:hypothetical protein LCGC14_1731780, partial [marine sediment metagenome]
MFEAFNKKEKRTYLASEAFVKFPDPYKEEWICCNEKDCTHIKVFAKKRHKRNHKGKEIHVTSHFFQSKNNEFKCSYSTKSDRHYNMQMHIASLLYDNDLKLKIGKNLTLPYTDKNLKGAEKIRGSNRADYLIEFEEFNEILGNGIVIEIKNTEVESSIEEKNKKWSSQGYSIAWVDAKEDFSGETPTFDTINVDLPYLLAISLQFKKLDESIRKTLRQSEAWELDINAKRKKAEEQFVESLSQKIDNLEISYENYKNNLEYEKTKIVNECIGRLDKPTIDTLHEKYKKLVERVITKEKIVRDWNEDAEKVCQELLSNFRWEAENITKTHKEQLEYNQIKIIEKVKEKNILTCRSCGWGAPNKKEEGAIACWRL